MFVSSSDMAAPLKNEEPSSSDEGGIGDITEGTTPAPTDSSPKKKSEGGELSFLDPSKIPFESIVGPQFASSLGCQPH